MSRRFTFVTLCLTAAVAFLVGTIFAGGIPRSAGVAGSGHQEREPSRAPLPGSSIDFADVVERINPAVVNIDASSRARGRQRGTTAAPTRIRTRSRRRSTSGAAVATATPATPTTRPAAAPAAGFIIDADGSILTNHHVIDRAERIIVKLSDGRSLRARVIGSDPATDIALIKIDGQTGPAGRAARRLVDAADGRVGLRDRQPARLRAHRHGRRRQLSRAEAVRREPRQLHPDRRGDQLRQQRRAAHQRARRGDRHQRGDQLARQQHRVRGADQRRDRHPAAAAGARTRQPRLHRRHAAQTSMPTCSRRSSCRSAGARWSRTSTTARRATAPGCSPTTPSSSLDDRAIANDDQLIHEIASRAPGSAAHLTLIRDGHEQTITVKLAERPARDREQARGGAPAPADRGKADPDGPLGFAVRDLDRRTAERLELPTADSRRARHARRADERVVRRRRRARRRAPRDQPPARRIGGRLPPARPRRRTPATSSPSTSTFPTSISAS